MIGWLIAYLAVGLASVALSAYSVKRDGGEMDPDRAIVATLAWPAFFAIVIGEMIAARQPKDGQ